MANPAAKIEQLDLAERVLVLMSSIGSTGNSSENSGEAKPLIHPISLIQIGSKYALGSDELSVTLYKCRVVKKTGKIAYDPVGYFLNFQQALQRLVDMNVQGCPDSCKFDCITELKNSITEAIKNLAQSPPLPEQAMIANQGKDEHAQQKSTAMNGLKSKRHR